MFGRATSSYRIMPEELALSSFSAGDAKTGEFKTVSYTTDNLAIVSHQLTDAETADHYKIEVAPCR